MDDKTKERLAEIGEAVEYNRPILESAHIMEDVKNVLRNLQFTYDLCQYLIKERDEARQWAEDWCMRELPWERTG